MIDSSLINPETDLGISAFLIEITSVDYPDTVAMKTLEFQVDVTQKPPRPSCNTTIDFGEAEAFMEYVNGTLG